MGAADKKEISQLIQAKNYNAASTLLIKQQNAHPELSDDYFYLTAMGVCAYFEGNKRAADFCFNKAFTVKGK